MIEGICLKTNVKIADRQALWNKGARFVYADVKKNSCLLSVVGDCNYQGFKFGGMARVRYNPGAGLGDTQAFEFSDSLAHIPSATLPPVLELSRDDGVLPDTRGYRDMLKDLLHKYQDYSKGGKLILKMSRSIAEWLVPDQFLLDYAFNYGLWIHEPLDQPLAAGAFRYYSLRSFKDRSVAGTACEWVQFPGSKAQFEAFTKDNVPVRFLLNGGTPPQDEDPVVPVPEDLTAAEKLAKAKDLARQIAEL